MPMIRAEELSKIYSQAKDSQVIFENLNFHIEPGEFVTFLGPSGCGKSTLLRLLADLERPTQGRIKNQSRRKSFVFQEPRLLPWRTCLENTLLPLEIKNGRLSDADKMRGEELLDQLGLEKDKDKFPHQLSGGMKMRNSVARSLIVNPDFLLLDEPFAALDETTRQNLQLELRKLFNKNQWTVAFVTHSIEEACFLSDRIFIFSKFRKSLIEHRSNLAKERNASLRDDLVFFEEVKAVRRIFTSEAQI